MPGLRGLRHPPRGPDAHARAGCEDRGRRVRLGHRLLQPLPVLHEHLRHPQHPRPRPGDRHRGGRGPARPRRVGDHRRRRRPVDRRQPPHPRPAAQRQPHDPAVQQPDLRLDQGPVLTDLRAGQGHEVDAVRVGRHAVQPALGGSRRRSHVRRTHARPRPQAHDRDLPGRPRPQGRGVRGDPPELQRLQRRRLRGHHRQGGAARHAHPPRGRPADPLRCRSREGRHDALRRPLEIVAVADVGEDAILVHDAAPPGPEPGLRPRPAGRQRPPADADRRVPRRRAPRVHHRGRAASWWRPPSARARATSPRCCARTAPGSSSSRASPGEHREGARPDAGLTPSRRAPSAARGRSWASGRRRWTSAASARCRWPSPRSGRR